MARTCRSGLCRGVLLTVNDPMRIGVFPDADINARGPRRSIESQIAGRGHLAVESAIGWVTADARAKGICRPAGRTESCPGADMAADSDTGVGSRHREESIAQRGAMRVDVSLRRLSLRQGIAGAG